MEITHCVDDRVRDVDEKVELVRNGVLNESLNPLYKQAPLLSIMTHMPGEIVSKLGKVIFNTVKGGSIEETPGTAKQSQQNYSNNLPSRRHSIPWET